jgi:hypothetical protein
MSSIVDDLIPLLESRYKATLTFQEIPIGVPGPPLIVLLDRAVHEPPLSGDEVFIGWPQTLKVSKSP